MEGGDRASRDLNPRDQALWHRSLSIVVPNPRFPGIISLEVNLAFGSVFALCPCLHFSHVSVDFLLVIEISAFH
jgi:hypothetical protein